MLKYVAILLLLFFLVGCSSDSTEEEENNTLLKAQEISFPLNLKGKLNNGKDLDYYVFNIEEDALYCFSISSLKGFDVMFEVLDVKGRLIKRADDYFQNFGESIPNVFLKKGKYYIKVSVGENDDKISRPVVVSSEFYQLKADLLTNTMKKNFEQLEFEPNDYLKQAILLKEGVTVSGFYQPFLNMRAKEPLIKRLIGKMKESTQKDFSDKDIDLYKFSVPNKGKYMLQMKLSEVENFDPVIVVFDEQYLKTNDKDKGSFLVIDSHSFDKGEGIANYQIQGNKQYYILITAMARLNHQKLDKILLNPYQLSYKLLSITADMELEPNDDFKTAKKIEHNVIKGYLNPLNDKDFYVMEGNEAAFYKLDFKAKSVNPRIIREYKMATVSVIPPSNVDIALYIFSEDKKLLKKIDNEGIGKTEQMPNLLVPLHRKLYFMVRGGRKNEVDNYEDSYEFKFYFNEKEYESMEHEPNDFVAAKSDSTQGANTFSDTINAYINDGGDKDNFYTLIPAAGKYKITLKPVPGATFMLELYDSSNFFIKKVRARGAGEAIVLEEFIPMKQVLRIQVYTLEKKFFNVKDSYSIQVTAVK